MVLKDIRAKVYEIVKQIPEGKVTTYGAIGKKLSISPRVVGYALHINSSDKVPCHRVVNHEGRLAPTFAFGGFKEHRIRLEKEGVTFKDDTHVDKKNIIIQL